MWRMLTGRATDLEVDLVASGVSEGEGAVDETASGAGESYGTARWIARYTFTQTGRPVVNDVRASFRFAGGRIAEHTDDFSFHRWARQALGAQGLLLGWTPIVRSAVRRRARAGLDEFIAADRAPGGDAPGEGAGPGE